MLKNLITGFITCIIFVLLLPIASVIAIVQGLILIGEEVIHTIQCERKRK